MKCQNRDSCMGLTTPHQALCSSIWPGSVSKSGVHSEIQGGHGTGKTGNLAVNFSRQGKHREFSKFNFLHRENCGNTGKILKI